MSFGLYQLTVPLVPDLLLPGLDGIEARHYLKVLVGMISDDIDSSYQFSYTTDIVNSTR